MRGELGKLSSSSALPGAPLPAAVPCTRGGTATCHLKAARDSEMKASESTFGAVTLVWELLLCHTVMAVGLCHKNTPGCVYRLQSRNINAARVMGCAWGMSPLGCLSSLTEHENLLCDHGTQGMNVRVGKPRVVPGWGEQQPPVLY